MQILILKCMVCPRANSIYLTSYNMQSKRSVFLSVDSTKTNYIATFTVATQLQELAEC